MSSNNLWECNWVREDKVFGDTVFRISSVDSASRIVEINDPHLVNVLDLIDWKLLVSDAKESDIVIAVVREKIWVFDKSDGNNPILLISRLNDA